MIYLSVEDKLHKTSDTALLKDGDLCEYEVAIIGTEENQETLVKIIATKTQLTKPFQVYRFLFC